jgi:transcriptional regulator with XRE-family HTH domain
MTSLHRRPDIERLLARRARQGLTFRELSEQSGIPIPTLSYWASKLRNEGVDFEARLVEVEILDDADPAPITIETQEGLRVTVEPGHGLHAP